MPEQIENRMVVDSEWKDIEKHQEEEKQVIHGYEDISSNTFVSDAVAFEYAFERCLKGTEQDKAEFREFLVDWFYSGNWVRR